MSSQATGPGKTAPKLLNDFYQYDPARVIKDYRVLVDPPPPWDESKPLPRLLDKDACKHDFVTKAIQSQLPLLDERAHQKTIWRVATVCNKCRLHADLTLDFTNAGRSICPNLAFPLHHFRPLHRNRQDVAHCSFVCSSWGCNAVLTVAYQPPFLDHKKLTLLTNPDNLMRRYRGILEDDPDRKDVNLATPSDALYRLKRYTDDALKPTTPKRQFPSHNKKFLGAFGSDCDEFLYSLGFKRAPVDESDAFVWILPNPGLTTSALQPDIHRRMLENLSVELQILLDQISLREGTPNPSARDPWRSSRQDIERLLSTQAYDRLPGRILSPTEVDHPCFGVLGALGDFSDPLIDFAYRRQTVADPENIPYYFDCLQQLAQGRNSEYLFVKTSEYSAEGVVGKRELEDAYADFSGDRDLTTNKTMDEQHLVNLYRAIVTDSGAERRAKLRQSLQKIGQSRNSKFILNAASDTVETYDEALAYLGAEPSMGDEAITALYGTKIGDSPENSETAQKAVKLIAEQRKSAALMGFINTGELTSYEMNIDDACSHLRIKFDPYMDEGVLGTAFEMARLDNPGQRTDQAIETIQKAIESRRNFGDNVQPPETWPVGLESHGNTCYLNSLLQYYFTIKPLRDLVLDIDQHKFDLATHETKSERVQRIQLKRYEIEAYQKFADHLRHLFQRMIKDRGPRVRPDTELVCGAFLTPNESRAVEEIGKADETAEAMDADNDKVDAEKQPKELEMPSIDTLKEGAPRPSSSASSATLIEEDDGTAAPSSQTLLLTPPASPKLDPPEPQNKPPLPPRPVLDRAKTQLELAEEAAKRQQDVAEVMEDLLRRLRAAIKPRGQDADEEQLDQLRDLFNMRFADTIISGGQAQTKKDEDATNILLNVPFEPTDIYSALDRVIDRRSDDIAGKPVEVYRTYTALPPLLQISVPRIALRDGSAVKVTHSLRLEETLYMDRYCDSAEVLEIRERCWDTRKLLRSLQAQKDLIQKTPVKDMTGPDVIEATGQYLSGLDDANANLESMGMEPIQIPDDLKSDLQDEAGGLRARLALIDDSIRGAEDSLMGVFDAYTQQKYRLYAVFFHRGGAAGGHYWMNMFDFKAKMWRKYNDETVTEFTDPIDDILNANRWEHGTPTYAVYVRDDVKDDFVDPVCREPEEEQPTGGLTDVPMTDVSQTWGDIIANVDDGSKEVQGDWESNGAYAEPSQQPPQGW